MSYRKNQTNDCALICSFRAPCQILFVRQAFRCNVQLQNEGEESSTSSTSDGESETESKFRDWFDDFPDLKVAIETAIKVTAFLVVSPAPVVDRIAHFKYFDCGVSPNRPSEA